MLYIRSLSKFAQFSFPSMLASLLVPATDVHPHSMMMPPSFFTTEMVLDGFPPGITLRSLEETTKDQRILFFSLWVLKVPSDLQDIKSRLVECYSDGCPSWSYSHLHTGSLELSQECKLGSWFPVLPGICSKLWDIWATLNATDFFCCLPLIYSSKQSCLLTQTEV